MKPSLSLPRGWEHAPLDSLAEVIVSTVDKKIYEGEQIVRVCNYTDVYYNGQITSDLQLRQASASIEQLSRSSILGGDVVITKDSETSEDIGRPAYVPQDIPDAVYGYHLATYRPKYPEYGRFLRYVFDAASVRYEFKSRTPGVTRVGLNQNTLRNLRVPAPPLAEAIAIADYLDRETAEIDAFIADQESFSLLVAERQRSLKFSLATGQVSDRPMSSVVTSIWNAIPKHWTVQKLGWHFDVGNGSTPKSDNPRFWSKDGTPWVNSSVVNEDLVVRPSRHVTNDALREAHLPLVQSGSLVIGLTGQGKTRGSVTTLGIDTTINQHLAYLTPRKNSSVTAPFLRLALEAAYSELRNLSDGSGGTKGALTCEVVQSFRIPVPPVEEQENLVARNREDQAKASEILTDARLAIGLAKERRAALISAAVTGQIDVTQRQKPVAEQLEEEVLQNA